MKTKDISDLEKALEITKMNYQQRVALEKYISAHREDQMKLGIEWRSSNSDKGYGFNGFYNSKAKDIDKDAISKYFQEALRAINDTKRQ